MRVVRSVAEMPNALGVRGFVPTMGALHAGHLSLMQQAGQECDEVVVSIFVNPLQFAPTEDFAKYPRQEVLDLDLCASVGVDVVFIPDSSFASAQRTNVSVEGLSERWEGRRRPGHFDGVATIVAKLFNVVQPEFSYFGLKDYQQCRVVAAMVEDLNFRLTLRFCETLRESDGLAMSSRNAYLNDDDRRKAPLLNKVLNSIREQLHDQPIEELITRSTNELSGAGFVVDYLALVDERSLEPIGKAMPASRLIIAAKLGNTWLIDNIEAGNVS